MRLSRLSEAQQLESTGVPDEPVPAAVARWIPVPPPQLLMTVAGSAEMSVFLDGGERAAASIREILRQNGVAIESLPAVLDFGCGCGPVLRHWKDLPHTDLHGTDYNPELAAWCEQNLRFVRVGTNQLAPPTRYAASGFDLIYALSVFTSAGAYAL